MQDKYRTYLRKLLYWRPVRSTIHASRLIVLPGFQGVPLFDTMVFFIKGLMKGVLNQRAAALSFHFFLALFPLILFLFTLLPYIPIENIYSQLYSFLKDILPSSIYETATNTLDGIFHQKHHGLMSLGAFTSIIVASNGVNAIIKSFNQTYHQVERRKWIKQRFLSIGLVSIISIGLIVSLSLILGYKTLVKMLIANGIFDSKIGLLFISSIKWGLLVSFVYMTFAMLYYFGPLNRSKYKFFSAGATLATILFILTTIGFNFYIEHFSRYNALYGSIGALIIFLLWTYLNSFVLLIGFELNASISHAHSEIFPENIHLSTTAKNKSLLRRWTRIFTKIFLRRK